MLARLARLLNTWWPDPARTRLHWWLIAIHVALVLLVGGGITWSASHELRELADAQGKARVQLAAAAAREDLRRLAEDALTAARALAERPALQRLAAEGQGDALPPLLRRSCAAAAVDACAVISGKGVIAVSGPAVDWPQVITASTEQGASFMALPALERVPVLGASAPLAGNAQLRIYVVRRLDERLAATLAHVAGAEVKLIDYRVYTAGTVNAFTPLYSAALADGHSAVLRIDSQDTYAASVPVFASTGEAIALVEALLPTSAVDSTARALIRKLLVTALILAALAVFAGVLLGELVAAPVRALTAAAMRIGSGDFSASIPAGGAAEVGALARTMEDMRRNLIDLTSTLRQREAEARAVLGGIVEGVYAVDRERLIRYLNPQAARLLGITPEQALGRFCGDVLQPQPEDGRRPCDFRCPILKARAEGSARALEQLAAQPGGARATVIVSAGPVDGLQVQVMREAGGVAEERAAPRGPQGA
jgi:PAS domain-containing protein